jgi:hypothetical protein
MLSKLKAVGQNARWILHLLAWSLVLLLPLGASAETWSWTFEQVDDAGKFTSLAVDATGNVHLSYSKDGEGIKYGFRDVDLSKWYTMVIDASAVSFTGIALDTEGNAHICYAPNVMKYAHWDGRKWEIEPINQGSGVQAYTCSVAIAQDGTPHVTWYQERNPDYSNYLHFKYAVLREGVWLARTIDFDAQTGKWTSMALDSQGNPHISYDAYVSGQLKYASWDGQNWVVRSVDARSASEQPYRGMGSSLALDPQGKAHISYYEGIEQGSLMYASEQGGKWKLETVDSLFSLGGWQGYRSSLALDQQGYPHIAYDDRGTLKHAYWDGKQWHIQVLAKSGPDLWRYPAISIGKQNNIYISYRDPVDGSLKVAIGHSAPEPPVTGDKNKPTH